LKYEIPNHFFSIFLFTTIVFGQKIKLSKKNGIIPYNTEISEVKFKGKKALKVNAIDGSKLAIVKIPNSNLKMVLSNLKWHLTGHQCTSGK
jgi:hypothetical protein